MVGSESYVCNARERIIAVQGQFRVIKVVDFGTNRKRVYDFLLVINSNIGPILHHFGDMVWRWFIGQKIASSHPPQSHKLPSLGVTPIKFRDEPDISRN